MRSSRVIPLLSAWSLLIGVPAFAAPETIDLVTLPAEPYEMVLDLDARRVVVSTYPGPVVAYDLDTHVEVAQGDRTLFGHGLTLDEQGDRLFVINWKNEVLQLDRSTLAVEASGTVGVRPLRLVFDEDRNRLYVSDHEADAIWIVDADTLQTLASVPLPSFASDLDQDPVTGNLYVTSPEAGVVTVIAPSGSILRSYPVGSPYLVEIDAAQRRAYVGAGSLRIIDLQTGVLSPPITVEDSNRCCMTAVAPDPLGPYVFIGGATLGMLHRETFEWYHFYPTAGTGDIVDAGVDPVTGFVLLLSQSGRSIEFVEPRRWDPAPPVTTLTRTPEPSIVVNGIGWTAEPTTLSWTCADTSACVETRWALDLEPSSVAPSPVEIPDEGKHVFGISSTDANGNQERGRTVWIGIDGTPPRTHAVDTLWPFGVDGWVREEHRVRFQCVDPARGPRPSLSGSVGCAGSDAGLNGAPLTRMTDIRVSAEGLHQLAYRSVDLLGNEEATRTLTLGVDRTAPTAVIVPTATEPSDGRWTRGQWQIDFTCTDRAGPSDVGSGCARVQREVNTAGATSAAGNGAFTLTNEGRHDVSFRGIDRVDNVAAWSKRSLWIDRGEPAVAMRTPSGIAAVSTTTAGPPLVAEAREVSLSTGEAGSGLASVCFEVTPADGSTPLGCFAATPRVRDQWSATPDLPSGSYRISTVATDHAGNVGRTDPIALTVVRVG